MKCRISWGCFLWRKLGAEKEKTTSLRYFEGNEKTKAWEEVYHFASVEVGRTGRIRYDQTSKKKS